MAALLAFEGVGRAYGAGDQVVHALRDVTLTIEAGELVAIMGVSGSGKSTLMHILGCLDRPTSGRYRVAGEDIGDMAPDELARLRREHFGFIFQRYQLLGDLSAVRNVEIPAIYSGMPAADRDARARRLLERLGLGDRMKHRPSELSGGQQQRVSIARALINGGEVILADEPTGALDSASSEEVLRILQELHADGHTVIIVTHDAQVAAHAHRVVELRDGVVVADRRAGDRTERTRPVDAGAAGHESRWRNAWSRAREAATMALRSMAGHRLRTALTMLGIVIGIASVVTVVALGEGNRQQTLKMLSSLGTNTIDLYAGLGFGDVRAGLARPLSTGDAAALATLDYVDSVTPLVTLSVALRRGNVNRTVQVSGVGDQFFRVRGHVLAEGQPFNAVAVRAQAQDAVIDDNTKRALFADGTPPIGQVILIGSVPVRIIGVTRSTASVFYSGDTLNVWVPYTTAMARLTGQDSFRSLTLRINDNASSAAAEAGVRRLLASRHGKVDFWVLNNDVARKNFEQTDRSSRLLISAIAVVSLIVGGIGVMNIMLVSVVERTQEIGIRMAVGARQGDVRQQFLIEAVLVCVIGGVIGVALALVIAATYTLLGQAERMIVSGSSIGIAFAVSSAVGIVFGLVPAHNAARLNPIDALAQG